MFVRRCSILYQYALDEDKRRIERTDIVLTKALQIEFNFEQEKETRSKNVSTVHNNVFLLS